MPPIWLISLAVKSGITGKAAKLAAWAIIAVAAILACLAVSYGIASLFQKHDDKVEQSVVRDVSLDAANRVIEADRATNAKIAEQVKQDQQNEKELDDAARATSNGSHTVSLLERMREQQQSGRR